MVIKSCGVVMVLVAFILAYLGGVRKMHPITNGFLSGYFGGLGIVCLSLAH